MLPPIRAWIDAWRPQQLLRTRKHLEDLRREVHAAVASISTTGERQSAATAALSRDVEALGASLTTLGKRLDEFDDTLSAAREELAALHLAERQSQAVLAAEALTAPERRALAETLADEASIAAHVRAAIAAAEVRWDPAPYLVVDGLFPESVYKAMLLGLPPSEASLHMPRNKAQFGVPFRTPIHTYGAEVWAFVVRRIAKRVFPEAVCEALRAPLESWLASEFPDHAIDLGSLRMRASDGRLLLRRPGYEIPPHRDPRWALVTCIVYLAREGDDPSWSTKLYSVDEDTQPGTAAPYWIERSRCHLVSEVEFLPNRALIFVNSRGAHGAAIPADAPPEAERYIYQFRISPAADAFEGLVASLPPNLRQAWRKSGARPG